MRHAILPAALVLLVGSAAAGLAHHGWGSYDAQNPLTLSGPIRTIAFTNPHVHAEIQAAGAMWEITLAPPSRMQSRGAEAAILPVGKTITAYGYASRTRQNELRAEWIEVDGRRFNLR
jgi:hypothetical protein